MNYNIGGSAFSDETITDNTIVLGAKTDLAKFKEQTALIHKEALDVVNNPVIKQGYQLSGKPSATAFTNVNAMAIKRMKRYYPLCSDLKNPLYARLFNCVLKICADVMLLKYEMRNQRIPFEHFKELDRRVNDFFENDFHTVQNEYKLLEAQ